MAVDGRGESMLSRHCGRFQSTSRLDRWSIDEVNLCCRGIVDGFSRHRDSNVGQSTRWMYVVEAVCTVSVDINRVDHWSIDEVDVCCRGSVDGFSRHQSSRSTRRATAVVWT
ncbi:hypothetical protein M8J77_018800 [Diaphorina citri]|nr:hypothetical protein M8J77_018800 [Diaphorina citri]